MSLQSETGIRSLRLLERVLEEVPFVLPGGCREASGGPGSTGLEDGLLFHIIGAFRCL